ncbi:MAG: DUF2961 domain-containing protein [Candidatus Sumerlaeia bacterium]|nr:DUF2961 domain-containing protein [Candidatus Sumerlaeia bacterium]
MKSPDFCTFPFDIARLRHGIRKRASSYDRTGGNNDAFKLAPGETITLAEIDGAGCITHLWFTVAHLDYYWPRRLILRCYWDGYEYPAVETPLGDFFGVGHGLVNHYASLLLNMVTNRKELPNQCAMNCFFPMPFATGAKLTITNESPLRCLAFYSYVDYELYEKLPAELGRFYAQYRQQYPTKGIDGTRLSGAELVSMPNLNGTENYIILEAQGRGHYVGCTLIIVNWDLSIPTYWFGEGDDMIFIDGEQWPPSLHGTGTEDYFCAAWGYPAGEYSMPFHGVSYKEPGQPGNYSGKWSMYRHHIFDPVMFNTSIRVTIEHGHANVSNADYSSVAYYYLATSTTRPHPALPESDKRLPRFLKAHQQSAYLRLLYVFEVLQQVEEKGKQRDPKFDIFQAMDQNLHDKMWQCIRQYHENNWLGSAQTADSLLHYLNRLAERL